MLLRPWIIRFMMIISAWWLRTSSYFSVQKFEKIHRNIGSEVESRTQGSRPRPRTAFSRTDTLEAKDRNARGQGQGPRTQALVLSKKKRSSQKFFKRSPQKNVFQKIFQALHKILTIRKIVLSSSRGQANFRGLEASRPRTWPSRPRPRTSNCVLEAKERPWGLHLCIGSSENPKQVRIPPITK